MERTPPPAGRAGLAAQRDARLQRASSLTRWIAGAAVLLVGAFAGIVAQAHPGRHVGSTPAASSTTTTTASPGDSASAPAAPSEVPSQTVAPPVAQSGGS